MKFNFNFFFITVTLLLTSCAKPFANFEVAQKDKKAPSQVQFTNLSKKAKSYTWNFGDGQNSSEFNPAHKFSKSGHYEVVLTAENGKKKSTFKQKVLVEAPQECQVEIITEFGSMIAVLYNATPKHRDNFIKLAEEKYFDDLLFHRVINRFMVQGGDPNSRGAKSGQQLGMGGPGYTVDAEFVDTLSHVKGALAAARMGDQMNPEKKSSGSQFYIVHGQPVSMDQLTQMESMQNFHYTPEQKKEYSELGGTPFLDMQYTVFGRVIKGLDVLDKIAASKTLPGDRPEKDIKMKIRVIH
jgi:cyclophilin family peptidyl-prolyl cis-trans isomerase